MEVGGAVATDGTHGDGEGELVNEADFPDGDERNAERAAEGPEATAAHAETGEFGDEEILGVEGDVWADGYFGECGFWHDF